MKQTTAHFITLWVAAFSKAVKGIEQLVCGSSALTMMQYRVLLQLSLPETASLRGGQLARALTAQPSSVSLAADALVEQGLLATSDVETDARGVLYALTPAGRETVGQVTVHVQGFLDAAAGHLSATDRAAYMALLYDALRRPGGFFAHLDPTIDRGDDLPCAYSVTVLESVVQLMTNAAKNNANLSLTELRFLLELMPKKRGALKSLRAKDLVDLLWIKRSFVTTVSRKLETRGFVEHAKDPDDARGVLFSLTPEGVRAANLIGDDIETLFCTLLAPGRRETEGDTRIMKVLLRGLEGARPQEDAAQKPRIREG